MLTQGARSIQQRSSGGGLRRVEARHTYIGSMGKGCATATLCSSNLYFALFSVYLALVFEWSKQGDVCMRCGCCQSVVFASNMPAARPSELSAKQAAHLWPTQQAASFGLLCFDQLIMPLCHQLCMVLPASCTHCKPMPGCDRFSQYMPCLVAHAMGSARCDLFKIAVRGPKSLADLL